MSRWYAILVSFLVLGATLSPIGQMFADVPQDSFPLSWYPMFHRPRPALEKHPYVVAVDANGDERILKGSNWDRGGMNQQREHLDAVVEQGPEAAARFCERLAARLAKREGTDTAVHIRYGKFSLEGWFREGKREPVEMAIVASCPIVRP